MQTLAFDGGPGPWVLLLPLIWAAVVIGVIAFVRRTAGRGRRGPRRFGGDDKSPIAVLGHRFATGEIDEDEYWRRLSVLKEEFSRAVKGGRA
ncbi:SHOCT domain-containing protein [Streptomyces sp. p1417]|uniref:SHOCT domain-containing protein n=1 Tax=Streptomyces typhae TaxID=2681492 RepID=A0A6L6X270_9ACTN|nr:SHOCT domain-containing protein [Streptomyces typhae]MVO87709.1 SHOCT domain-containing protein [Streptomyces typhae]